MPHAEGQHIPTENLLDNLGLHFLGLRTAHLLGPRGGTHQWQSANLSAV